MPRNRLSALFTATTLLLSGCEQYPFLPGSGGSPGGSSSGTGGGIFGTATGDANSGTNGNGNAANANANTSDATPTTATGDVAQELCGQFIVILERDGTRNLNVYQAVAQGDFADWSVGDDVGFAADSGALVDFTNGQTITAELLGEYDANTLLVDRSEITQSITLQNGSVWTYAGDYAAEVRQWRPGSDQITVLVASGTSATIINRTRCTSIVGQSQ
ncbi:MAG: hypothetical protein HZB38_07645 [Planctomycetes bacterium]|nr:hypothetical protein [Planctomycetota bacterium]